MTSLAGAVRAVDAGDLLESFQADATAGMALVQSGLDRFTPATVATEALGVSAKAKYASHRVASAYAVPNESAAYHIAKRTLDVIGSLIGLILISPLIAILAVLNKLSDGG